MAERASPDVQAIAAAAPVVGQAKHKKLGLSLSAFSFFNSHFNFKKKKHGDIHDHLSDQRAPEIVAPCPSSPSRRRAARRSLELDGHRGEYKATLRHYALQPYLRERSYYGDSVLPLFESGIPLLLRRLRALPDHANISIAYPDEGAYRRFHFSFKAEGFPEVICTQVRNGAQRVVRLKEGEAKGRHIVIVDDLVQTGDTLLECQAALSGHGADCVSAYVTHGVFPNMSWQRFKSDRGQGAAFGFRYFWITDWCPSAEEVCRPGEGGPFEILSLTAPTLPV